MQSRVCHMTWQFSCISICSRRRVQNLPLFVPGEHGKPFKWLNYLWWRHANNSMSSYCEGKGRERPRWTLWRAALLAPQEGRTCWPHLSAPRRAAQSWGELPRAEGSRLLPQALQDSSAGTPLHFRPPRKSTEASIGIASEPNFFPSLFHSAPYPSLAWSAGHSPLNFLQVNIWLRVCCPGILTWALTSLTPSHIILRISPVR